MEGRSICDHIDVPALEHREGFADEQLMKLFASPGFQVIAADFENVAIRDRDQISCVDRLTEQRRATREYPQEHAGRPPGRIIL